MLPIRDHNPSRAMPFVTWALIAANILIFISYWPLFDQPFALQRFFETWGLVPAQSTAQPLGFITSMFLHGGVMHLFGNMLFLWIFGDNMEEEMGHLGFLAFYLATGIAAALGQIAADPASQVPMVGASGAIAGVMGGYLLLFPKARVDVLIFLVIFVRIIPVPAWIVLGFWFGSQIVSGSLASAELGGGAYWAHAGGFLAGVALSLKVWLSRGGAGFWRRTEGHPPHAEASYRYVRTSVPRVPRRR
ncbi:rhomboid family intramembrane serine protease [Ovoidimarina sediminis]|uniref:rhomboid family intramembrane serine protease n=1 Tax=Ovoidimarina sediminis TaxID=3079856 RepID=UPI00290BA689|nr:rhomboid family intramembrane serine protease [Rhodophyticola sp. MJ-SS7]MDU8944917.1 rhomboid family intramembrane serine protease [Rhodophyticola sp. MJ-SS7]